MFTREVNTNVARNMKFLCDFCEFEASWKTTLRRHIQSALDPLSPLRIKLTATESLSELSLW